MDERKNQFYLFISVVFLLTSLSSCTAHPAEYKNEPLYELEQETYLTSQIKPTEKVTEVPDQPAGSTSTDQTRKIQQDLEFTTLTESQSDPVVSSEPKDPEVSEKPAQIQEITSTETKEPTTSILPTEIKTEKKPAEVTNPSERITAMTTQQITETTLAEETSPATPNPELQPETVEAIPAPSDSPSLSHTEMAEEIFHQLNKYRTENGLPAFKRGEALMWKAALIRAQEIVINLDHWRPNNRSWNDVMWEVGIGDHYSLMSECLSHCAPWDEAQFIAYYWDRSWAHKMYILSPDHITAAIGYINKGDEGQYTVLIMTDDMK